MTRDGVDIESGFVETILVGSNVNAFHSWSTASTAATLGLADDESINGQNSSHGDMVKSSRVITGCTSSHDTRHTTCPSTTILIFGIAIIAVIATSVAFCNKQPDTQKEPQHLDAAKAGASMETFAASDASQQGFWNPLVDLHVDYDPFNPYRYILQDQNGLCNPQITTDMVTNEVSMNNWTGVQPTPQSIASMGILPHIQTSRESFLALEKQCGMELSPNQNWTLSFAGARLSTGNADIIFLGGDNNNNGTKRNAPFAVCYLDDNSIGIGSCTKDNDSNGIFEDNEGDNEEEEEDDDETLVIPLLYSTREFHVLTLTYNAQDRRLQIYQDTHLAADMELGELSLPTSISWIGPPHPYDSSSSAASKIALRHVSYFDRHVQGGNVVEIADLILHMSI